MDFIKSESITSRRGFELNIVFPCSRWNFVDIARLLLHYDAPIDAKNKMNLTPLEYAVVSHK